MTIKRRDFLKGSAIAAGAFTLGFMIPVRARAGEIQNAGSEFAPNAFIRVAPDNSVTVILSKSEI